MTWDGRFGLAAGAFELEWSLGGRGTRRGVRVALSAGAVEGVAEPAGGSAWRLRDGLSLWAVELGGSTRVCTTRPGVRDGMTVGVVESEPPPQPDSATSAIATIGTVRLIDP